MDKIASINIKSIVAKVNEIIEVISSMPGKYDDTKLRNDVSKKIDCGISDLSKKQDELARAQNALKNEVDAIEMPKPQNLEPLLKRIKALEEKPEPPKVEKYDDSTLLGKLAEIEKSIESLDRRLDFVKRTYSEKWSSIQFDKASDDKLIARRFYAIESEIESIKNSVCHITK